MSSIKRSPGRRVFAVRPRKPPWRQSAGPEGGALPKGPRLGRRKTDPFLPQQQCTSHGWQPTRDHPDLRSSFSDKLRPRTTLSTLCPTLKSCTSLCLFGPFACGSSQLAWPQVPFLCCPCNGFGNLGSALFDVCSSHWASTKYTDVL